MAWLVQRYFYARPVAGPLSPCGIIRPKSATTSSAGSHPRAHTVILPQYTSTLILLSAPITLVLMAAGPRQFINFRSPQRWVNGPWWPVKPVVTPPMIGRIMCRITFLWIKGRITWVDSNWFTHYHMMAGHWMRMVNNAGFPWGAWGNSNVMWRVTTVPNEHLQGRAKPWSAWRGLCTELKTPCSCMQPGPQVWTTHGMQHPFCMFRQWVASGWGSSPRHPEHGHRCGVMPASHPITSDIHTPACPATNIAQPHTFTSA